MNSVNMFSRTIRRPCGSPTRALARARAGRPLGLGRSSVPDGRGQPRGASYGLPPRAQTRRGVERAGRRRAPVRLPSMHVVLPDDSTLEVAGRRHRPRRRAAIGPRLASATAAVKVDGALQDLRLPVPDGATSRSCASATRALPVLRHSTAHVLAEAVRHLYPGGQGHDRAADRERLLLRLRVPGADRRGRPRADRGRDAPHRPPRACVHRAWYARRGSRPASRRGRAVQGRADRRPARRTSTITLYTQDDFTDLCRGPHLQSTSRSGPSS